MQHPEPTFAYLVSTIRATYPRFSYIHVVEPRIAGSTEREALPSESNDFLRSIWKGPDSERNHSVYFSAGGYDIEGALKGAEEKGDVVVFGRYFISNVSLRTLSSAHCLPQLSARSSCTNQERHRLVHV